MVYSVINIDIIGSRKITNRKTVQAASIKHIEQMNRKYKTILAAPITLTLGDEIQILLKAPYKSYMIINCFQRFFDQFHLDIYAGFGTGTILTNLYDDTRRMDGPCFVNARKALEIAKTKNPFYNQYVKSKDNYVFFYSDDIPLTSDRHQHLTLSPYLFSNEVAVTKVEEQITFNQLINNLISNNEILKKKLTKKQKDIISHYEEAGSYSKMIDNNPSLTKASISQKLTASNYSQILLNNMLLEQMLYEYCQEMIFNLNPND